jgi:hypothetical protein
MSTGDHLRAVRPGDAFPRDQATINAWQRAARDRQGSERMKSFPPLHFAPSSPGVIRVKNDTGQHLDRFSVLGISAPIFQPSEAPNEYFQRPWFTGIYPAEDEHVNKIVVIQEPLRDGAIGEAIWRGLTWVQVNFTSAAHEYAVIDDGVPAWLASSSASGNRILWRESGAGPKMAWVELKAVSAKAYGGLYRVLTGGYNGVFAKASWGYKYQTGTGRYRDTGVGYTSPGYSGLVCQTAGDYLVHATALLSGLSSGIKYLEGTLTTDRLPNTVYENAVDFFDASGAEMAAISLSSIMHLTVGEEVSLWLRTDASVGQYSHGGRLVICKISE